MKGSVALCMSKLRLRALTARILAAYLSKNRYAALNLKELRGEHLWRAGRLREDR